MKPLFQHEYYYQIRAMAQKLIDNETFYQRVTFYWTKTHTVI